MGNESAIYCANCDSYYYGNSHTCVVYDGPLCRDCGNPTQVVWNAAPGIGRFLLCHYGHEEEL